MRKKVLVLLTVLIMLLAGLSGLVACVADDGKEENDNVTKYTVTFVADGKTVGTATYTEKDKNITEPEVPSKDGYIGVWEDYELTTGDKTVNAVYYEIYTVTFVVDGKTVGTATYTEKDKNITEPEVPSKDGYMGVWEDYELTTGNKTVNALYYEIYTVTFVAEGVTVGTVTYTEINKDIVEPDVPNKLGYAGEWERYKLNTGDKTVNAVYTAIVTPGLFYKKLSDGSYSVSDYTGTDTEVFIPNTYNGNAVTSIGTSAFGNSVDVKLIVIPNTVTSISSYAFRGCSSLSSIEIPNSVIKIGAEAFAGCGSLASIKIPASVTNIGFDAFYECDSLESVEVAAENTNYRSEENCIIYKPANRLLMGLNSSVIPESVTSIGSSAFKSSKIVNIVIPNKVTLISADAFNGCSNLVSIIIPDSVEAISDTAFSNCTSLKSVFFGKGLTILGADVFSNCGSLEKIEVAEGNSTFRIEGNCLINDNALIMGFKSCVIPDSVIEIKAGAFENYNGLTSIFIPKGIIAIRIGAFRGCSSLESIEVAAENTTYRSEGNCIIENKTNKLVAGCKTSIIPDSVKIIGSSAFLGCSDLVSIIIPESVTTIEHTAFSGCTNLKSIKISVNVADIKANVFYECTSLESIEYSGSKAEWKAIKKSSGWNGSTGEYTVTCNDGALTKAESK